MSPVHYALNQCKEASQILKDNCIPFTELSLHTYPQLYVKLLSG